MRRLSLIAAMCGAITLGMWSLAPSAHAQSGFAPLDGGTVELAQHRGWRLLRGFGYYPRPYFRNNYYGGYYGNYYQGPGYYQSYRPYYGNYWW